MHILRGEQLLPACSSSSELTFSWEFLQEPIDFTTNSPVYGSAVRPLKQAQLKQNHLTPRVIQASCTHKHNRYQVDGPDQRLPYY